MAARKIVSRQSSSTIRRRKSLFENREEVEDENISIVYDDELTFILFFARQAIPSEFRGTDAFAAFGGKNAK